MFTIENYVSTFDQELLQSMPSELKKAHDFFLEATENGTDFSFYKEDPATRKTLDLYLEKLNALLNSKKKVTSKPSKLSTPSIKKSVDRSIVPPKSKPQKKNYKPSDINAKGVEKIDDAVRLIQRYVALNGKTKTVGSLLPFIKAIQRAMLEKRVSKKHKHGSLIEKIQQQLVDVYNKFKPELTIPFLIAEPELSRYVKIAGGEKVYKSISFIKRIVSLQGKEPDKKYLEKLAADIEKARIQESDPYASKLNESFNTIKLAYKKGGTVQLSTQDLKGLSGIVKTCGCSSRELGTIYNRPGKKTRQCTSKKYSDAKAGACSHHRGLKRKGLGNLPDTMTASQMMAIQVNELPFSGKWLALMGRPGEGFKLMVHGGPGSGKSSLLLDFAHYLATGFGPVLYVTSEEYSPKTMNLKLSGLPNFPDNFVLTRTLNGRELGQYKFVFLDSINHMKLSLEEFIKLGEKYPDISFIYIMQHTKEGTFRGGMDWEHEADIAMEVSNYNSSVYKNRFGVKGNLNFFNPDRVLSLNY